MKCKACNGTGKAINHRHLGNDFKAIRRAKRMTQRDVAVKMKISIQYLCDLELGRRNWNADLMDRYERALK